MRISDDKHLFCARQHRSVIRTPIYRHIDYLYLVSGVPFFVPLGSKTTSSSSPAKHSHFCQNLPRAPATTPRNSFFDGTPVCPGQDPDSQTSPVSPIKTPSQAQQRSPESRRTGDPHNHLTLPNHPQASIHLRLRQSTTRRCSFRCIPHLLLQEIYVVLRRSPFLSLSLSHQSLSTSDALALVFPSPAGNPP